MIKKIDNNLNKLFSFEKERELNKQAIIYISNKLSQMLIGGCVVFTYYNYYY